MDKPMGHLGLDNATHLLREIMEHDLECLLIWVNIEETVVNEIEDYEYCKNRMSVQWFDASKSLIKMHQKTNRVLGLDTGPYC